MSPFGASAVWVQRLNGSPLIQGAGLPGRPMVSSTLPSSVHLRTVWSPSSVQKIVSSGAMLMPWARANRPSPQERRKLPVAVEHDHRVLAAVEDIDAGRAGPRRPRRRRRVPSPRAVFPSRRRCGSGTRRFQGWCSFPFPRGPGAIFPRLPAARHTGRCPGPQQVRRASSRDGFALDPPRARGPWNPTLSWLRSSPESEVDGI